MVLFCLFRRARVWFPPPTLKETPLFMVPLQAHPVRLVAAPRCCPQPLRDVAPPGGVAAAPGGGGGLAGGGGRGQEQR